MPSPRSWQRVPHHGGQRSVDEVLDLDRGGVDRAARAVMVSVMGALRLTARDRRIPVASGSRSEQLLFCLALRRSHRVPRSDVLEWVWPDADTALAGQSLN